MPTCPACSHVFELPHGKRPLTKRQSELLDWIETFRAMRGYSPTFEEIGEHFGFRSLATVSEHLVNLQRKGYITRAYNEPRSILVHR